MSAEQNNQFRLIEAIFAQSVAKTWDEAKLESELKGIHREEEPRTCLCGHTPIIEICVLRNRSNGHSAVVGNVCVTKFLGLESERIFSSLRRVARDQAKALSAEAIQYAFDQRWISDWEHKFCLNTRSKRKLSAKQAVIRAEINHRVVARTTNTLRATA